MSLDWQELTRLTQGRPFVVERVRLTDQGVAVEGSFELPQLARLTVEDQVFVTAFVRSHGSLKEMERIFGISYPTVKARLNRIAAGLEFVETGPLPDPDIAGAADAAETAASRTEILGRLRRGEITADDAVRDLERLR